MATEPLAYYKNRIKSLAVTLQTLQHKKRLLAWGRFFLMITLLLSIFFMLSKSIWFGLPAIVLLAVFIRIVYRDIANNELIRHTILLTEINEQEIKALQGNYFHYKDGLEYTPHIHDYANDIDIFGRASIFQYMNRISSQMGSDTLAEWLLAPASVHHITERQDAVKELAQQPGWMQDLQGFGKRKRIADSVKERLHSWIHEPTVFLQNGLYVFLQYAFPLAMVACIALNIAGLVSDVARNYCLLAAGLVAYITGKKVTLMHVKLSKIAEELSVLSDSIQLIESVTFKSPLLLQLQTIYKTDKSLASVEIKKLQNILERFDYRLNPFVFIPLALIFQWDLQQAMALEKWKKKNKLNINNWFDALGELEALSSMAVLHFNHPAWHFPLVTDDYFSIHAKDLGHPLINATKRVNNYIDIDKSGDIMLVTGSNMAGKSTYLRSVGTNVVLAMMGAPVCAASFSVSHVQLLSSMRIADNLEENTSTFYAELKKLKNIIEKVNNKERVFILLDEILRGTNSLDRHTGSEALIKQLVKHKAAAVVATHDLGLAALKQTFPEHLYNYHFDAQVDKEELFFDYKLKEGVSNSINASILMKKIGIEL